MPKLNFYDTDAVKAFVLNILVENAELRQEVNTLTQRSDAWFHDYLKLRERADAAEAQVAALKLAIDDTTAARAEAYLNEKHLQEGRDDA